MVLNSNKTFSAWAEIDLRPPRRGGRDGRGLVHHAEVIVLTGGDSYRLKGKGKEVLGSELTR